MLYYCILVIMFLSYIMLNYNYFRLNLKMTGKLQLEQVFFFKVIKMKPFQMLDLQTHCCVQIFFLT